MGTPDYRGRAAEQIITENIFHDAYGFGFRAASWLDLARRTGHFATIHYACIDARLAIEHLIFELTVITSGESFTNEEYERCLCEPRKLANLLKRINPHYEKLLTFTGIIVSLQPDAPSINQWDTGKLMKSWGVLSSLLHWSGAHAHTTEHSGWQSAMLRKAAGIIEPLWQKMSSAGTGCMVPENMHPATREVWLDFRDGRTDSKGARIRLELVRPFLKK